MSYTVLAVKWRPKRFNELVGQPHVVQALVNSLAAERLHHAYLFSGTRGVGKTTVARILAKALNCEQGVVQEPCGVCAACVAIDQGRFVDLIEVDAASRTRVDDTRELLDNVQYAPTHGRFKVYLIDEVHMLSNHSFNALLKTLEEPPPHVKFLLATTDPQKLPITVLSRCLQFNLKKLTVAQIVEQLAKICSAEGTEAEPDGLRALALAAEGSMRDALSLLDQSIAFGGGAVEAEQVASMLGSLDRRHVHGILAALAEQDGAELLAQVEQLDELAPDYSAVLDDLAASLQQIAVLQLVNGKPVGEEQEPLVPFADSLTPEDVQLFYQIALHGRRDLAYSRDPRVGFEMTLLRMLAFRPVTDEQPPREPAKRGRSTVAPARKAARKSVQADPPVSSLPVHTPNDNVVVDTTLPGGGAAPNAEPPQRSALAAASIGDWGELLAAAEIRGPARQLGDNCAVLRIERHAIELMLRPSHKHLNTDQVRSRLQSALSDHLGSPQRLSIDIGQPPTATPAEIRIASENDRMRRARESIEQDPVVQAVRNVFGGVVEADSVQPIDES